ncbi:methyltransferase domain-containing protein [Micromonospora sp. CPCC 206061]|uniref:methyltransferase domain-containing protein n=1 Tax=Micromonospora sp. CPCC 206061 TaxID=3122410 RepID=UPI002FF34D8A
MVYTHGHHEAVLRSHRWRTAENSAGYLLGELRPGMSLLDVGCGPGTITLDLAARVAPGRVVGIDAAPDALAAAPQAATVDFQAGDVYALAFPDGAFDVVHAHQVLQHLAEPVAALREMRRVCQPGGFVAARDADYAAMTWYPEIPALGEWLALYRQVARHNGGEPDAGRKLLSWAREAGFTDVRATASAWCFAAPEDRAWWSQSWADRVSKSAFGATALAAGYATEADLARIVDAWREWGAVEDSWFAVLHGEVLCRT